MEKRPATLWIPFSLVLAITFWGANNVALKEMMQVWHPLWTGSSRFLCAGFILHLVLKQWRGADSIQPPLEINRWRLWWAGGGSLALYIFVCNWALRFIPASHFALEMATVPVIALLLEPRVRDWGIQTRRWMAALLALLGVFILLWPALRGEGTWFGELLGVCSAVLWVLHSRQCQHLSRGWNGPAVTAHTMWRAGVIMAPLAVIETWAIGSLPEMSWRMLGLQAFCITLGGVLPFALWNHALTTWPVSRVSLFGNLLPISTMFWAGLFLGEPASKTFWIAMTFILGGVLVGQAAPNLRLRRWKP